MTEKRKKKRGNGKGNLSLKEKDLKSPKHKRWLRSTASKYLRPGALVQLRNINMLPTESCADIGKKRVVGFDVQKTNSKLGLQNQSNQGSPTYLSPIQSGCGPVVAPLQMLKQYSLPKTPKNSTAEDCESESRLESLPMDLLIKILCHLHHDQLKAAFHVSQRIRKAVLLARQSHFNYTTPDRSRQEILRITTPLPTERWPFVSKKDGKCLWNPSPHTPKAPRQGPRPPSRMKFTEMRQVAAVLFPEPAYPSKCMNPPVLPKSLCRSFASSRVLLYEDELCQAVAQNKLR